MRIFNDEILDEDLQPRIFNWGRLRVVETHVPGRPELVPGPGSCEFRPPRPPNHSAIQYGIAACSSANI